MSPANSDVQFHVVPVHSLSTIETLWQALEGRHCSSFFVSWTWIGTWLRQLPKWIHPLLLQVNRGGHPIAAAILIRRRAKRMGFFGVRQLHFNATGESAYDCVTTEHNDFVGKVDATVWSDLLAWFARGEAEADELFLPGICRPARDFVTAECRLLDKKREMPGFACELSRTPLLHSLSSNSRQQLRRSIRACEGLGMLRIEAARSTDQALFWFGELKMLHVRHWTNQRKSHAFENAFFEYFHVALIEAGIATGRVNVRKISAGLQVLGYLYDFMSDGRISAYQSGFNDDWRKLRPGYVAHALAMEQVAAAGCHEYDFLAGDNRLKRSFASRTYELGWHCFRRPSALVWLESAAIRAIRQRQGEP
ncbi:MAG TPA: GNAT family N-acetyltransferase [Rhizomicrobium sp.]|jgi:CelD/BcsL family acetyltransferase involved in cellulose biosynthesis